VKKRDLLHPCHPLVRPDTKNLRLNQVISEIQNDSINSIIINPERMSGKSLGIILNVLSERNYQLRKYESKQIQSDRTLIDATLDNPSSLYDCKLKLGN